ncbi:Glycosyltransferase involved in cell wall bisynthesis [Streptomyces zhaozhouensis]|uniref:Glycosyltransferase involved in cell wall bisynthesis n=1 Tax=Streptomyces zhaozhouensis TaxID=1300267 RepID=A0A286DT89_9ACTN|nr:glycosyltransferase family 4 protein [Streptomyces zhaozhouensis]SOD61823.1 Glycosyltransferase involved in cell wall bisynthesis [Streptomyces zhaozhouensis]
MSSSPPSPRRRVPLHVVQLLGGGGVGTGDHVRSLSAGLADRGLAVTVGAAGSAERRYGFASAGARFVPLPVDSTLTAVRLLRLACADADLVHAHGIRAGLLATLALRGRSVPLVVTWHARSTGIGPTAQLRLLSERLVARTATVVLGATSDLVHRARQRGARDARLAPVALPAARRSAHADRIADAHRAKLRADLGASDRPLLVAAARSGRDGGLDLLLAAARYWRDRLPRPLLALATDGHDRALSRRIERGRLPVRLLAPGEDPVELLPIADLAVLPARWAGRPPLVDGALRRGVPLVATAVGGVPEVVGDAGVLVPSGKPAALGSAVNALLDDPDRRAALAIAGPAQARRWPTEDTTVAQVLSVYDELVTGR